VSSVKDQAVPPEDTVEDRQASASVIETPRQALYKQVHDLRVQGLSLDAIGGRVGLSRPTVRKYLRADACPERAPRRTKIGAGTDHDSFLRERWAEGCHDAVVLWKELKGRGFRGTIRTVQRHVASWRSGDNLQGSVCDGGTVRARATSSPAMSPPSPRELRWWLLPINAEQPAEQVRYVERLVTSCPAIATAQGLARRFTDIVRTRDAPALAPWLVDAAMSPLPEFRDFAAGLRRDVAAVEAALTHAWSNGQTEGQVTKLKMLKRQMYGRASVPLLRQRLLLAA
jgi:transposase